MDQLSLFPSEAEILETDVRQIRLRLLNRGRGPDFEDPFGLALGHLPPAPDGDPAFDRFGLFVADLPRKELPNCLAEHRIPWTLGISPR